MSPRFVLGRENVPCVAEVVNRSLKADCTDFKYSSEVLLISTINISAPFCIKLTFPEFHFETEDKVDFPSACI